jgi:hypothetical protein
MKKFIFFAALAVFAIGSYGRNTIGTAHAQTITPTQTAALEQELDVAKATLANLEMQAGMVPPGDSGSATVATQTPVVTAQPVVTSAGLSTSQISALNGTLSTLATMLTQLSASVAVNTTLTPAQQASVAATLGNMNSILANIVSTVKNGGYAVASTQSFTPAPIAAAIPSSGSGATTGIHPTTAASNPSTAANSAPATAPAVTAQATPPPVVAQSAPTTPAATNNPAPAQTAQAWTIWSFTKAHWPTIVIVLLIIAILAILFWPEKETAVKTVSTGNSGSGKPKSAPVPAPSTANLSQNNPSSGKPVMNVSNGPAAPATPVANAVAAPAQK